MRVSMRFKGRGPVLLVFVVLLTAAACSGGEDDATSNTTLAPLVSTTGTGITTGSTGGTAVTGTTTTGSGATSSTITSTTSADLSFPQYVIYRRDTGDAGDTVVVLLDPTSYDSLTDIDLENVLSDVTDRFTPVYELGVAGVGVSARRGFQSGGGSRALRGPYGRPGRGPR